MSSLRRRWRGLFIATGDLRAVALVRLLFGPIVVFHLWGFWDAAVRGETYQDRFHVPFWQMLPDPPETVYAAGLTVGILAGAAMTLGLGSRLATTTAFLIVGYNLLLDQTFFQHNRAFLVMNLGMLALQPTGCALSVDAVLHRLRHGEPPQGTGLLWPLVLQRVLITSVYLSSGVSKLLDPDWAGGLVLWDRVVRFQHELEVLPFHDVLLDVLTSRGFYRGFAPIVLATELFIGLGLWHRRTRLAAVWIAVAFHTAIELTADVHTFSYAALAALAMWAVPRTRDRVVTVANARTARLVRAFDWLGRFRVETNSDIPTVTLQDRDGTVHRGAPARRRILLRLPATFFFVAPGVGARRLRPDQPATSASTPPKPVDPSRSR